MSLHNHFDATDTLLLSKVRLVAEHMAKTQEVEEEFIVALYKLQQRKSQLMAQYTSELKAGLDLLRSTESVKEDKESDSSTLTKQSGSESDGQYSTYMIPPPVLKEPQSMTNDEVRSSDLPSDSKALYQFQPPTQTQTWWPFQSRPSIHSSIPIAPEPAQISLAASSPTHSVRIQSHTISAEDSNERSERNE